MAIELSIEEKSVLNCIKDGKSTKEISKQIGESEYKINKLVNSIVQKLNAKNRTHAIYRALKEGIIK